MTVTLEQITPVIALLETAHTETSFSTCPVCEKHWRPWVGSFLQCHAKCLYSADDQGRILHYCENAKENLDAIAERLGISLAVLKAVTVETMRRRRRS